MKKINLYVVAISAIVLSCSIAFAKEAKEFDFKFNPNVDFSKVDSKNITIYDFENIAGIGDDVMGTLYEEMTEVLKGHEITATTIKSTVAGEKDEFSLEKQKTSGDPASNYKDSPTDLVISGKLNRMDYHSKSGFMSSGKYWSGSLELYIYSKTLDTIIYKVDITRIHKQKGGSNKEARRTLFSSMIEEAIKPYLEKLNNPSADTKKTDG